MLSCQTYEMRGKILSFSSFSFLSLFLRISTINHIVRECSQYDYFSKYDNSYLEYDKHWSTTMPASTIIILYFVRPQAKRKKKKK